VCVALGVCAPGREGLLDPWPTDVVRIQQLREGMLREAGQRGGIVYPKP